MSNPRRRTLAAASLLTLAGVGVTGGIIGMNASASPDPTAQIVGGREDNNPWVVQLSFTQGSGTYGCTGEAIAADWVLTAQHCTDGTDVMNVYYSNDVTNRGPAIRADHLYGSPHGDVALIHLSQSKELSEYGQLTSGFTPSRGGKATIQGYGLQAAKQRPTHLNSADVQILGTSSDAYQGQAIHVKGIDGASNHGDSGGPIIVDGTIVGVCSTGDSADPGSDIHAGSNYANLTDSLDWIKQTTGGLGPSNRPTHSPTTSPTDGPTDDPTDSPTSGPTDDPTEGPTDGPTWRPTFTPTNRPTEYPTWRPTHTPRPTVPTYDPSNYPTYDPSGDPTSPDDEYNPYDPYNPYRPAGRG